MEEEFRAILLGATAITDICGARIDFGEGLQGKPRAAIILNVISDSSGHNLKGADGLQVNRVQVDCYGETYKSAKVLSRAVRSALDGYRGGNFSGVFHAGSRDGREGGTNKADRPFRNSIDFLTNWRA